MTPIIRTKNLTHVYSEGTPFQKTAIHDITFEVQKGEFLAIIGHTGSGKSTFIQHLNALLRPTDGKIYLDGEDVFETKERMRAARFRVGLVFQYPEYQLFEDTVYKDISFGPKNMGLSAEEVDERVREAARFVSLSDDILQKSPFEISGGQKRRAAIAGVIAMRPEVLILDEPTAGLDPTGCAEIIDNIRRYHSEKGATIIMVTHNMDDAAKYAQRMLVMNRGTVAMDGTPREIFARYDELEKMSLSVPDITKIFIKLKNKGINVDSSVYTIEQATQALCRLKGGADNA